MKTILETVERSPNAQRINYLIGGDMSKTYLAACMWMVVKLRKMNELRQYHVCDACQCTPVALRNAARRIFVCVDADFEMLDKLTVDEFISGVRI